MEGYFHVLIFSVTLALFHSAFQLFCFGPHKWKVVNPFSVWPRCLHPGRLTWNLQITKCRKENDLEPNLHDNYVPAVNLQGGVTILHLPKNQLCVQIHCQTVSGWFFPKISRGFTSSSPRCLSKATLLASLSSTSWALRATLRCTSCGRQRLGMQDMSKNWRFLSGVVGKWYGCFQK